MQKIDFLSLPPSNKLSIFNQRKNKTQLGGSIFIIEIIAIILITFIYLFDHFKTSSYTIESNEIIQTSKLLDETDERFDQAKKFTFNIITDYNNEVSDNFIVSKFPSIIGGYPSNDLRKTGITESPSKLKLGIYYKCYNTTLCKYFPRDKEDKDYTLEYYELRITYPGYAITHQGEIPLSENGYISIKCPFLFETITYTKFNWRNIKYEEESGMWSRFFNNYLLGKKPVSYVNGYIESYSTLL